MNIVTLQTNSQSVDAQLVYGQFMHWVSTTNTDLMSMSPAEINKSIHIANGGPIRSPHHLAQRGQIINPLAWHQAYNMVMQLREELDDDDNLYPAGVQPAGESEDQGEGQDEDDMLYPAGVGRPKKEDSENGK